MFSHALQVEGGRSEVHGPDLAPQDEAVAVQACRCGGEPHGRQVHVSGGLKGMINKEWIIYPLEGKGIMKGGESSMERL